MGVLKIYMLMSVLGASTTVTIHSVGSLRETGSVRCGSKVTFVCSIPTYKYTMKWLIDADEVAKCVTTNCVQYPPYKVDNIEFSPDTSNGQFNLTINQVTLKADGRKIKSCYGSESDQLKLAVKVLPGRNTTEIVESKDRHRNMIRITATTGCVFPSSAITMKWYYYEEGQTPKLYKRSSPIEDSIPSVCSSGTCGGNGVVKLSSTLSIPAERNGKEYVFQIAIRHEDTGDIILVNSRRSYKIDEITSEIDKATNLPVVGIIIGTSIASLLLSVALFILAPKLKRKLLNIRLPGLSSAFYRRNRQPIPRIEENTNEMDLTETRKASDAETKLLDDSDKTEEEGNNDDSGTCSNDWISIHETKHIRNRQPSLSPNIIVLGIEDTEHENKTAVKETIKASVTTLLDDLEKTKKEGNNDDSGRNDTTSNKTTKHISISQPTPSPNNIIVLGFEDTENENKTALKETSKVSVTTFLDDLEKTKEEGNNDDSGSNDSTSKHETKHICISQPQTSTANLTVHGIKDTENENKTDITDTRKASVAYLLDDSDKTKEEEYNADSGGNAIHMQTSRVMKKPT